MNVLRSGKLRFKSTPLALFLPVKYPLLSGPYGAKVHHRGEYRVGAGRLGVRAAGTGRCNGASVPLSRNTRVIAGRRIKGIGTDRESQ